MKQHVG